MIDFTSTPIILTMMLGSVGVIIPVISVARKEKGSSLYGGIAFAALISAISFVGYQIVSKHVTPAAIFSKNVLVDDTFGSFFAIAMLIVAIMTTVGSFNYMRGKTSPAVYYSLILLSSIGMVLIAYSTDLVMLFVAWELMSIPTYVLAGFAKKDPSSNEAALKYFLFGALSSGIIIYGISIAYGITGSTNIGQVIAGFSKLGPDMTPLALLAVAMFIAGFGFKIGLVPFHMWLPDTYEGAPPTISALLAAGTKKAGFAAALRVIIMGAIALAGVPPLNGFWSKLMLFGAAINAGSVMSWAPYLAVAGVLNSALSLAYYGWIIRKMYFEEGESEKRVKEPKSVIAVMIFSIIFIVGIGVYPDPFIEFAKSAVPALTNVTTML